MNIINRNKHSIIGVMIGTVSGYLYYYFVGCANGTCAITSSPINSSIYGAVMGALVLNIFKKEEPKSEEK